MIDDPATNPGSFPHSFPVGKTLIFPITAADAENEPLTFKVTSNNPKVIVRAKTGEPSLKMAVTYGSPTQTGEMVFALFREWTPITTGFIGGFAQSGFFDTVKFHRVVSGFAIQGGDPLGLGSGGPGMTGNDPATAFKFENEFQPGLIFSGRGQLAMANSGYGTDFSGSNGSQFFVSLGQPRFLDFKHTIFGQLLRGWATLDGIAAVPVHNNASVPPEQSAPDTDVVITSATVEPNNHDAVLMISATGAATNAVITVTATDSTGAISLPRTFTVSAVTDTSNSPPVVLGVAPLAGPKETQLNFGLRTFDLEFDYPSLNHGILAGNAVDLSQGFTGAIRGNPGFEGQARLAFEISQFNVGQGRFEDPVVHEFALIGIGDRAVRSDPVTVTGAPGSPFTGVVARFKDSDIAGSAADFATTVINWGDGTPVQAGALAHDATVPGSSTYAVTGTHSYARAGNYTIVVTTTGNKGAVGIARNPAIITAGPIVAVGQQFDVRGPTAANRILATFTDSGAPARPTDYTATVDWGDGQVSKGVVAKVGTGFVVRGTHVYKDTEPFAVSVRVHKAGAAAASDAFARSTVNVFGFVVAPHLPPFPMAHLVAAWNSGPSKELPGNITGTTLDFSTFSELFIGSFVVLNSGNKPSPPGTLRYWLSSNPTVDAGDTLLLVNGLPAITISSFGAGLGGTGSFTISLPKGMNGTGKYLLGELMYSDPIIDASRVDKVVVSGPLRAGVLVYALSSQLGRASSGQWLTDENLRTATFRVVLDTQPTANVVVPLESSVTTEGTVSPASLTFTSGNWNVGQLVTVTGVNDAVADGSQIYTITVKAPTSTDPNYTAVSATSIPFANLDND